MGSGRTKCVRTLTAAFVLLLPASAFGHVLMENPKPRNERDDLKPPTYPAPCGNVARTSSFTEYQAGSTIQVTFKETIAHAGCFQVGFSESDDQNFTVLAQQIDPAGGAGTSYTMNVKLPDGVTCENCTLQLRQQMSGTPECPVDPNSPAITSTYYSCADIRVRDFPDGGPSAPPEDEDDGGASGGPTTVPTDGGGKTASPGSRRLSSVDSGEGGCSVAAGATGGFSLFATAGLGALAMLRRRRRRDH